MGYIKQTKQGYSVQIVEEGGGSNQLPLTSKTITKGGGALMSPQTEAHEDLSCYPQQTKLVQKRGWEGERADSREPLDRVS